MKWFSTLICVFTLIISAAIADTYQAPQLPYAPQTGSEGSEAILYSDPSIVSWATEVVAVKFGSEIEDGNNWKDTDSALGMPTGDNTAVLVLGRGGDVILGFSPGIADGTGFDFVVFENAITRTFLEVAFVEVSSDGEHFVRFPNYSATPSPVDSYGSVLATNLHGLAGKYSWAGEGSIPYGTPFDLAVLELAFGAAVAGYGGFSDEYANHLVANFPHLDTTAVRYVRIVDIVGDGSSRDCEGYVIYDPFPTWGTAGFDLDAVGVVNAAAPVSISFSEWSVGFGLDGTRDSDHDLDGWKDGLEYQFGTNPVDRMDVPAFTVSAEGVVGGYQLVYKTSAVAEGSLVVYFSSDGQVWDFLEDHPPVPEGIIWSDGKPFLEHGIPAPGQGDGYFQFRLAEGN